MPMSDLSTHLRVAHGITPVQSNLRQLVYGGNDGIVTTFAIVAGFAGAGAEGAAQLGALAVLLFGLANLFADATAMGLGEFLSSRSERDVYRATRAREMHLIHTDPEAEYAEVLALLERRGLSRADAAQFADQLCRHPELLGDFMMAYEYSMAGGDDEDGIRNGLFTFFSFLVFGTVPLLPYFLMEPNDLAFRLSVLGTASALFALGVLRWAATREAMLRCVAETMAVGGTCALVAYLVGWIIGG